MLRKAKEYKENDRVIFVRRSREEGRSVALWEWAHPVTLKAHGTKTGEYVRFATERDAIDAALRYGYAVNKQ
jgi:hypothetical protein